MVISYSISELEQGIIHQVVVAPLKLQADAWGSVQAHEDGGVTVALSRATCVCV